MNARDLHCSAAPATPSEGRWWTPAVTLGFVLIALKLAVLALPPLGLSPVHVPGSVPGLPGFEEWRRGMAAEEWLRGPLLPWLDYQQGHFQGGTLVTIALATASFAAFGASPFAMRLPNLLFDLSGLFALVWLVDRSAGRRAAWIAGAFAAVASPGYWVVGAAAWASHVESNGQALVLLAVWAHHVFYGGRGPRRAFGLGVLAGLALWYHYGIALWLGVMLVVEAMHAPRRIVSRDMAWRVAGALVGLLPWFVYNLQYHWAGLGLYGRSASEHVQLDGAAAWSAFCDLWREFLPGSTWFPDLPGVAGSGRALGFVCLAAAVLAWLGVARHSLAKLRARRAVGAELVFVLQPPLWMAAYTFSEFHGDPKWAQGYRYMLAVHPAAWALGGIALARLAAHGPRVARRVTAVATVAALALTAALVARLEPQHLARAFEAPGRNLESLGRWLYYRRLDSPEVLVEAARRLVTERDPVEADVVLYTLGNTLAFQLGLPAPPVADGARRVAHDKALSQAEAARAALAASVPAEYGPYFAPARAGERPWPWAQRDQFWRQWDRRGGGRPPGAYAR
ncbi:MAG: hypothetical protein R3F49_16340 [Planctomycetota bacterium]